MTPTGRVSIPGAMKPGFLVGMVVLFSSLPAAPVGAQERHMDLENQVRNAERAFARTMAERDVIAFSSFISEEAVFFGRRTLRGRTEIVDGWSAFFEGDDAPFSWEPDRVEVLPSGTLAHSSGPIRDPEGQQVGTFNSVWRLELDGRWRVVFDKGCSPGG